MPYQDDPLFDLKAGTSADDVSISSVMRRYNARNCKFIIRTCACFVFNVCEVRVTLRIFVYFSQTFVYHRP